MLETVLIFGATGSTGGSIINALIECANFKLIAAIRPASSEKPIVAELKAKGVDIVLLDLDSPQDKLRDVLNGVDTVISTIVGPHFKLQYSLADAAKEAGVKRFVPSDFGTSCVRGIRKLYDVKADIHDHIEKIGLGYTYIDVGWWLNAPYSLPILENKLGLPPMVVDGSLSIYGAGNVKVAYTDLRDVGKFVARIIADPRTLNRYVFVWGEERTQQEVFDIARAASGKDIQPIHKSEADVKAIIASGGPATATIWEYIYSISIRGDNTIENAKKPEYGSALDARELYPDIPVRTLVDFAQEKYAK